MSYDRPYSERPYIKWYVDDSQGYLLLSLAERGLAEGLARKVNRDGFLRLSYGLEGLASLLRVGEEELRDALAGLLRKKRVEWAIADEVLFVPGHKERQEAAASDAVRAQAYRDRQSARALPPSPPSEPSVTERHAASRSVTERHAASPLDQIRSDQIKTKHADARAEPDALERPEEPARASPSEIRIRAVTWRPPPSEARMNGPAWAEAFERAVEVAIGTPFTCGPKFLRVFERILAKHCPAKRRAEFVDWLAEDVHRFAKLWHGNMPRGGLSPDGYENWLNDGRPTSRPGLAGKPQPPAQAPPAEVTATDMARWAKEKQSAVSPPPELFAAVGLGGTGRSR